MQDSNIIIEIIGVSKTYSGAKIPAVNNLNLSVPAGEIFGLLGPNGAGKTTTISMLCGMFAPGEGDIYINHLSMRTDRERIKALIGVAPQDIALYPNLTARENLRFIGHMYGMRGTALKVRIEECLSMVGLSDTKRKRIGSFSGGMKRRVNLIASLLHDPKILFLDEPTVGVDVQSRNVILEYLMKLRKNGTTIIYTSHYLEEAESLCSLVGIIDDGRLIANGTPDKLLNQHPDCRNLESIFLKITGKQLRD